MPQPSEKPEAAAFRPYVAAEVQMAESTPRAVALGAVLGVIFGAVSVYLALKAGLTALGLTYTANEKHQLPQLNAVRIPPGIDDLAVRKRGFSQATSP